MDFVNGKLFPYLKKIKTDAEHADTIEYKIDEIFSELKNRIQSGYNLREVVNLIDELRFRTHKEKHEMSHLYEAKIKNMGNAGRNGGEYYTPRPLIKTIVKVVAPNIGNKIYDGAVGSAGFLCEAIKYLKQSKKVSTAESENSWTVNIKDIDQTTFDLSAKNPNVTNEEVLRKPNEILDDINKLDIESLEIIKKIRNLIEV